MRPTAAFLLVALVAAVYSAPAEDDKYTTKYDNVDVDAILTNDRLLRNYIDCLLGKKKCTKDGEELKKVLPDALKTGCSKCSDWQKETSRKVARHLLKNKREWWNEVEQKFDPAGEYIKKYHDELVKEGIEL